VSGARQVRAEDRADGTGSENGELEFRHGRRAALGA
jgi:hypothetical protein